MLTTRVEMSSGAGLDNVNTLSTSLLTDQRFVVRLWKDDVSESGDAGHDGWHGQIVTVGGGESRYFRRLSELDEFVISVLEGMGVRFPWTHRVRSTLSGVLRRTT
jgi:hypothetical protein